MNQKMLLSLFVTATIVLAACSSNTQNENTGIGAVTGAVVGGLAGSAIGQGAGRVVAVGAGAIIGALIGGKIGQSMDNSDNAHVVNTMNSGEVHKSTTWVNAKTGTTYTIIPTSKVMHMGKYDYCRKYRSTANINGKMYTAHGVACRQADGSWVTVK